MKIKYADDKVKQQCTSLEAAKKAFGGDKGLAVSLLARINAIEAADVIMDIIVTPQLHFIICMGKWKGYLPLM